MLYTHFQNVECNIYVSSLCIMYPCSNIRPLFEDVACCYYCLNSLFIEYTHHQSFGFGSKHTFHSASKLGGQNLFMQNFIATFISQSFYVSLTINAKNFNDLVIKRNTSIQRNVCTPLKNIPQSGLGYRLLVPQVPQWKHHNKQTKTKV